MHKVLSKIWTLEEARDIFPKVKQITKEYNERTLELSILIRDTILPENKMEEMEEEINDLIREWADLIRSMDIDAKGVWLIDFDNGKGYYCWKIGEEELLYEHSYEDGYAGRRLIQDKE
jgi:hypothetical protein